MFFSATYVSTQYLLPYLKREMIYTQFFKNHFSSKSLKALKNGTVQQLQNQIWTRKVFLPIALARDFARPPVLLQSPPELKLSLSNLVDVLIMHLFHVERSIRVLLRVLSKIIGTPSNYITFLFCPFVKWIRIN